MPVPPAPPATILPITHLSDDVASSPTATPPVEYLAREEMAGSEMDIEVTESAFGEALPDDALVDEFPVSDAPSVADDATEQPTPAPDRRSEDLVLPSWIDEIVARRQSLGTRAAAAPWTPPAETPEPAAPFAGFGSSAPTPSGAMLAAPPPQRIAPHPAEPIPLFDRAGDSTDRFSPRLRGKLEEDEEAGTVRRPSMAWPIASLVIAAIAIAVLLVVRFSPWSLQRRDVAPAGTPPPSAAPDTSLHSIGPFPPLDGASGSGTVTTTVPIGGQAPAPAPSGPRGTTALALREPVASALPEGSAPGSTGDPAVPSALIGVSSYGIVVGTYLNEGRANAERSRLGTSTELSTRVMPVAEDTVAMYRVVVGSFPDRSSAERTASDLVQRGLVAEARVIAVAGAPARP